MVLAAVSPPLPGTRAHTRSVMNSRTARATSGELDTAWVSVTNGFPGSSAPSSHWARNRSTMRAPSRSAPRAWVWTARGSAGRSRQATNSPALSAK